MKTRTLHQQALNVMLAAMVVADSACAASRAPRFAGSPAALAANEVAAVEAPPAMPQDMFFADYCVNRFLDAAVDNRSTFGVDVDTGAYTLARSYVNNGNLPPEEAVRVEEFVNFFDYHYANPAAAETFGIEMDAAPSPFTANPANRILRIGIQGYDLPADERKDAALTFVIDVSGSMARDNRLELVKRSLIRMVDELRPTDSVALVVYGSRAWVVQPMTPVAEKEAILRAIASIHPGGSTNAEEGLRLGYRLAWQNFDPAALNRVILCSDGVANVGATGPGAILAAIGQYAAKGVYLTTVGVGMGNYNDVLMEQLADQGDGFYAYVDSDAQAKKLFVHDLTGTLQTIAKDAKVQVAFNPATVARYRLMGYENRDVADDDFRNDAVDGGEIGAGHSVTALYELELQPNAQTTPDRLATVHLRWQQPETGEAVEISREFPGAAMQTDFAASPASLQLATVVAAYAEVLRGGEWAETATLNDVLSETERIKALLAADQQLDDDTAEFFDLVWRANQIALAESRQ